MMNQNSELKALLFDVDGTLADTERDGHRVAFNYAFKEAGLDWEWSVERYGELLAVTGGKERIKYFLDEFEASFQAPEDLTGFIADLHQKKTAHYLEMLQQGAIPLRNGVERLLNEVREAGFILGIVTTTTPENVTYLLEATLGKESLGWFSVIAAGDIVPAKKPAADIYLYAMEKLGLSAENCLAFEDSGNGILSSHAANLSTIVTINDYTAEHDFTAADLVLDQFGEPDAPCRVISGNMNGAGYLGVKEIQSLWSER